MGRALRQTVNMFWSSQLLKRSQVRIDWHAGQMDRIQKHQMEARKYGPTSNQHPMHDVSDFARGSSGPTYDIPHGTNRPQTYPISGPDAAVAPRQPYQDLYPQSYTTDAAFHDEWKDEWNDTWSVNKGLESSANFSENNAAYPHHIQGDSMLSSPLDTAFKSLWTQNTITGSNPELPYPQAGPSSVRGASNSEQWGFGPFGDSPAMTDTSGLSMDGVPDRRAYQQDAPRFLPESNYGPASSPSASSHTAFARPFDKPDTWSDGNATSIFPKMMYNQSQDTHEWNTGSPR